MAYVKRTDGVIKGVRSHDDEGYEYLDEESQEFIDFITPEDNEEE